MAFTVEDFNDLLSLLAQHPEWRAELRRHVLTDDLLSLPSLVQQLVEAIAALTLRVDALTEAQARTDAAVRELAQAQARTESQLHRIEGRMDRVEATLDRLAAAQARTEDRLGDVDGRMLEFDFARKAPSYLGHLVRRLRIIEPVRLADLLDDAIDEGKITWDDRVSILRADAVLSGRHRQDGHDMYLVVEVSGGVRTYDVERASTRAKLLEKLGRPVLAVVAGRRVHDDAAALARTLGVWMAEEGSITVPQTPDPSHRAARRRGASGGSSVRILRSYKRRGCTMRLREIVHSDPEILSGVPVFVGTRVPVQSIFDYLEGGDTLDELLHQFPSVKREQALAVLDIARQTLLAHARSA